MKAFLKNYRQSPRKVRLVADLIKGKNVEQALISLEFLAKRAGMPIKKLVLSAVANAKNIGMEDSVLFIKDLRVDKGVVMKRMMPRAMGRGARINKRTSHVTLLLAAKTEKTKKEVKNNKKSVKNTQDIISETKPVKKVKAKK